MSLNLYSLIIKTCEENNINANLEEIGKVNDSINDLISRGICKEWIECNLDILL